MSGPRLRSRFDGGGQVPELTVEAARLILGGLEAKEVALATGMNLRTVYRWRKELRAVETVTVDGWTATFARFVYRQPVRISAWERAA